MAAARYAGFTAESVAFLNELAANNNREWFKENKSRYEEQVLDVEPHNAEALQTAVDLAERLNRHEDLAAILESRLTVERDPLLRAALLERRGDLLAGSLGQLDEAAAAYREALAAYDRRRADTRRCKRWGTSHPRTARGHS